MDGHRGQQRACQRGSKKMLRSVLLASLFPLNEESRSAKGEECFWGRMEASGDQLGQGLDGVKCLPNELEDEELVHHPTQPLGKASLQAGGHRHLESQK